MPEIDALNQKIEAVNRARRSGETSPEEELIERIYQPSTKLFVYGSLGPGQSNNHLLLNIGGTWKSATIHGHILRPEPGNNLRYPRLRFEPGASAGSTENGDVFISENLPGYWSRIDQFEGSTYIRLLVMVHYDNGNRDVTNVYASSTR